MDIMEPIMEPIEKPRMKLLILPERLAICRLDRDAAIPDWACSQGTSFYSITRTPHELSIVCLEEDVPAGVECDGGWRVIGSLGPLGFTLTGLVEGLAEPLAVAGITIFYISTYNSDFCMVKDSELHIALLALANQGHEIVRGSEQGR